MPAKLQKRPPVRSATSSDGIPVLERARKNDGLNQGFKQTLRKLVPRPSGRRAFSMDTVPVTTGVATARSAQTSPSIPVSPVLKAELGDMKAVFNCKTSDTSSSSSTETKADRRIEGPEEAPQCSPPSTESERHLRSRSFSRLGRVKEDDAALSSVYDSLDGILQQNAPTETAVTASPTREIQAIPSEEPVDAQTETVITANPTGYTHPLPSDEPAGARTDSTVMTAGSTQEVRALPIDKPVNEVSGKQALILD